MPDLKYIVPVNATPEKVYAAVATQAGMKSWWTADTHMEEKVGGKADFGFENHQFVFHMTIEKLDPGRCVVMRCHGDQPEWDGTTLTWTIVPENGASVLRFNQRWKAQTDMVAMCNSTWGELVHRLKDYVEGRNPGPHWTK